MGVIILIGQNEWLISFRLPQQLAYSVIPTEFQVDFDALPIEARLRSGVLRGAWNILNLLIGAVLLLVANVADDPYFPLIMGIFMIVFAIHRFVRTFKYSRSVTFHPEYVHVRWWLKTQDIPYDEFIAIRKTAVSTITTIYPRSHLTYCYLIELVHPKKHLSVPILVAEQSKHLERELLANAQRFNLPIWRYNGHAKYTLNPNDFDTKFADRVLAKNSIYTSVPPILPPPPRDIHVQTIVNDNGETEIQFRTQPRRLLALGFITATVILIFLDVIFFGPISSLVDFLSIAELVAMGIPVSILTVILLLTHMANPTNTYEDIKLEAGNVTIKEIVQNKERDVRKKSRIALGEVEELFHSTHYDRMGGLICVTGQTPVNFGYTVSKSSRKWLHDFLINYIRKSYQPDEGE